MILKNKITNKNLEKDIDAPLFLFLSLAEQTHCSFHPGTRDILIQFKP
jgi:hypothetical protein